MKMSIYYPDIRHTCQMCWLGNRLMSIRDSQIRYLNGTLRNVFLH